MGLSQTVKRDNNFAAKPAGYPVCRPLLPSVQAIAPYISQIDDNRFYTNNGPLSKLFRARLAEHYYGSDKRVDIAATAWQEKVDTVVLLSNATMALSLCLSIAKSMTQKGVRNRYGPEAWMPSWTFAATPCAAVQAGLAPRFLDVDPHTGILDPAKVYSCIEALGILPRVVIPVAPFGAPLNYKKWEEFHQKTGIPVVIDAAAGFDTVEAPSMLRSSGSLYCIVVSLHATKCLPAGEGAFVLANNPAVASEISSLANFGFKNQQRVSTLVGTNAKMSEYAVAVALASLDAWPKTRATLVDKVTYYQDNLPQGCALVGYEGMSGHRFSPKPWASASCVVSLPLGTWSKGVGKASSPTLYSLQKRLAASGVQTRRWYEEGCHKMPAFSIYPVFHQGLSSRDKGIVKRGTLTAALPATDYLSATTLGLPFYQDISHQAIEDITKTLERAISLV